MAKSVRTSISIPTELKARMDAVEEEISWSALACAAFEVKLAEIAKRKAVMERADVIARLRASRQQTTDHLFKTGFAAGEKWAKTEADAWELINLAEFHDKITHKERLTLAEFFFVDRDEEVKDKHGFAKSIASGALGMNRDDYDDTIAETKALAMFDNQIYVMKEPLYVHGFLEGALDVWRQVKNEL